MTTDQPGERLLALDVFRGGAIAAMILVNNPGTWGAIYPPLRHAKWHGWTPTDLVFPFFLWIVGVAIVLALGRRVMGGEPLAAVRHKIVRRAVVLVLIGLGLNAFPELLYRPLATLETLRLPGVLQRIGICYGAAALLFVNCRARSLVAVIVALLLGYGALLAWTAVPGMGAPDLADPARSIAAWLDRRLLGEAHLWSVAKVYDPEGLLSTLGALATTLCGVLAGVVVRSPLPIVERVAKLMVGGVALVAVGYVWDWFLPINKALWTSSYAIFTAGLASCAFGMALWICDVRGRRAWVRRPENRRAKRRFGGRRAPAGKAVEAILVGAKRRRGDLRLRPRPRWVEPLRVYGVNALTVFVGSALVARIMARIEIGDGNLKVWLYARLCRSWLDGEPASLCWALLWVLGWYGVLRAMDRRGWRVRV